MTGVYIVLLIVGLLCFLVAAVRAQPPVAPRLNLVALGLAFWITVSLIAQIRVAAP